MLPIRLNVEPSIFLMQTKRQPRRASLGRRSFSSDRTTTSSAGGSTRGRSQSRRPGARSGSRSRSFSSDSRGGNRSTGSRRTRGGRVMPTFDPSQFINKNPVVVETEVYEPKHTFASFKLNNKLTSTILTMGINRPTPIQDQIIPHILEGRDVIGLAETGTGKTAAFLIPLIEQTLKEYSRQTIILTPTRELAIQVEDELRKLSAGHKIFSVVCVGGVSIRPQIQRLRRPNHFIIGTPGRVQDLINQRRINMSKTTTVVLDEADRMLDMGFINDIKRILVDVPVEREMLLFSATLNAATEKIVHDFLRDPVVISVKKKDVTDSIAQDVVRYVEADKFDTLTGLLQSTESFTRTIIFTAMKHQAEKLANDLSRAGISAESIHGNKNHTQRQRSLKNFKSGQARVLVATDVAARGIHVDNVSHVINYDLPNTFEDYVHRIGRTGRGDKRGQALTFVAGKV